MNNKKIVHWFIITTFVSLYAVVSIISTVHVVDFFQLSNPFWLAVSLAVAFEIGAAASLASLIVMEKMNRSLVWSLFILLTAMQMMGNTYYAFGHLHDYQGWVELFGLSEEEPLYQKRVLSIISGAILPLVALGFIKSLVDYIKPGSKIKAITEDNKEIVEKLDEYHSDNVEEDFSVWEKSTVDDLLDFSSDEFLPEPIEETLGIKETSTKEETVIATQREAVELSKEPKVDSAEPDEEEKKSLI